MKWPSLNQWRQFLKVLSQREKFIFFLFFVLFIGSLFFLSINFYFKNTGVLPAKGGVYIEGVVGSPRFINPIYAPASDVDRDLSELIYSGLMKYDLNGKIVPDLAESYQILEDGKIYQFQLKENLFWSDGKPITADDVIFTIKAIQNPASKSPLRLSWLDVEVEKISEKIFSFRLKNPSAVFLENCTLKIMPRHIWEDIPPQNFPLAIYNLNPIGSGPYQLKNLSQDPQGNIKSLELVRNEKYFGDSPNISRLVFKFFNSEEDLIKAAEKEEVKGFSATNLTNWSNWTNLNFSLPRYFALFFNPDKAKALADQRVRQALNYGTNKEEIVEKLFEGRAEIIDSPILPEIFGFKEPSKIYQFDLEKTKKILSEAGFSEGEEGYQIKIIKKEPVFQLKSNLRFGSRGKEVEELQKCLAKDSKVYPEGVVSGYFGQKTSEAVIRFQEKYRKEILDPFEIEKGTGEVRSLTRKKLNEICFKPEEEIIPLKFSLSTVDQPVLIKVANLLKDQWKEFGAEIEIKTFDILTLEQDVIKPRDYEILLFGEVLGAIPDPYPFWHSSQKKDPGLNLAIYKNERADKILKEARQISDEGKRRKLLENFQDILIEDAPAIFLYSPNYLYFVSDEIKGIKTGMIVDPSKRFTQIGDWYIKTKRVWRPPTRHPK